MNNKWVSVKDLQPPLHKKVLLCIEFPEKSCEIGYRFNDFAYVISSANHLVTERVSHWMERPDLPEEDV